MKYVAGLVKGVLKADDHQGNQCKQIFNDALDTVKEKLTEEEQTNLKGLIYRFGIGVHGVKEIENVVQDYQNQVRIK